MRIGAGGILCPWPSFSRCRGWTKQAEALQSTQYTPTQKLSKCVAASLGYRRINLIPVNAYVPPSGGYGDADALTSSTACREPYCVPSASTKSPSMKSFTSGC